MTGTKFVQRGLIGVGVACFMFCMIIIIISVSSGGELSVAPEYLLRFTGSETTAFALQFALCCVMGFVFAGSSVFFENERWSLTMQTLLHFLCMSVAFLGTAWFCGWMYPSISGVFIFVGIFLVIYFFIWLGQYLGMRKKIRKLNEELMASRK